MDSIGLVFRHHCITEGRFWPISLSFIYLFTFSFIGFGFLFGCVEAAESKGSKEVPIKTGVAIAVECGRAGGGRGGGRGVSEGRLVRLRWFS